MDQLLFAGNETTSPLEGSCFLLSAVRRFPTPYFEPFRQKANILNVHQLLFATVFVVASRLNLSR